MDAGSLTLFIRLISMGSSSLLQYVGESFPWTADRADAALKSVLSIAHEEREEVTRFTRILQKKRLRQPAMGAYPSHFTTINFCSLDYMLPKLIAEHQAEIAEIEMRLPTAEEAEIRALAASYLDMKRRHLQTLKDLTAQTPSAGAA